MTFFSISYISTQSLHSRLLSQYSMFRPFLGFQFLRCLPSAVILLLVLPISSAKCYYPNGKVDSRYRQCPNSLSCCLQGESCLSNGLCFTGNFGILYRGLCADTSWPIAECPRACYTGNSPKTLSLLIKNLPNHPSRLIEIADGWANLFQCNTSSTLLTCSHDVSAGTACLAKNALGTFEYQTANVTVAQNGVSHRDHFPTNTTARNLTSQTTSQTLASLTGIPSSTCPSTVTYNKTQLVAIGAGLGAGLGLPLIIIGGALIYCNKRKRREQRDRQQESEQPKEREKDDQYQHQYQPQTTEERHINNHMHRRTGTIWKPSELRSSFAAQNELWGSYHGRAELPGSI